MKHKRFQVKQIGSTIRHERSQLDTLKCLGLGRIGKIVEHEANPSVIGMLKKISHLVEVREVSAK